MTDAEIIADLFGSPCNYYPVDEEMASTGECEYICGSPEATDAKCWQRYFDLKKKENDRQRKDSRRD